MKKLCCLFLALLLFPGCAKTLIEEMNQAKFFDDYRLLNPPISGSIVGAKWNRINGIAGLGLPEDRLVSLTSISDLSELNRQEIKASIIASISRAFTGGASGSAIDASKITIKGADLVRVRDLLSIGSLDSEFYVWDAVRVNEFEISTVNADSASANISAILPTSNISVQGGGGSNRTINVKGAGLFIGYRLIGFDPVSKRDISVISIPPSSLYSATLLGDKYKMLLEIMEQNDSVVFQPPKSIASGCKYTMKMISMAGITPTTYYWKMKCPGRSDNDIYFLDRVFKSDEVVTDTLILNKVNFDMDAGYNVICNQGEFTLQEWKLKLKRAN